MFAICIEASHMRGMGHLFRALNLLSYFEEKKESYIIFLNDDDASVNILKERNVSYEIIDFEDKNDDWVKKLIKKYNISVWLNDKFESSYSLCHNIKKEGIPLAVIDDRGAGASLADVHFAGMMFGENAKRIKGKHIFLGADYNILNPEIVKYRKKRAKLHKIIVTLGGSDTYGVTVQVVKLLKRYGYKADIVVGANFRHSKELKEAVDDKYHIFYTVPSLMEMFSSYDLAITGGGVTPFEANAAGLPCVIIANEPHEIDTGKYLEQMGGSVFAGFYQELNENVFELNRLNIEMMSEKALCSVNLDGRKNVWRELKKLENRYCS